MILTFRTQRMKKKTIDYRDIEPTFETEKVKCKNSIIEKISSKFCSSTIRSHNITECRIIEMLIPK